MSELKKCIDELFRILEDATPTFRSKRIAVDKDRFNDVLVELEGSIPTEISQAKKIIDECESYIQEAKDKAENIIKNAQQEADDLVSDHKIYLDAIDRASTVMSEADQTVYEGINSAIDFTDDIFELSETLLVKSHSEIIEKLDSCHGYIKSIEQNLNKDITTLNNEFVDILDAIYKSREDIRSREDTRTRGE
ncbi:MAG: hypothetical protein ACK5LT_10090 [Lachnospirales bacterium]